MKIWVERVDLYVKLYHIWGVKIRNNPLPHHGQQKDEILEQMELVGIERLEDYNVWLERMRKAE